MDGTVDQAIAALAAGSGCSVERARDFLATVADRERESLDEAARYVLDHLNRATAWRQGRGYDR